MLENKPNKIAFAELTAPRGWLTPIVRALVVAGSSGGRLLLPAAELPPGINVDEAMRLSARRANIVEAFVCACFVLEVVALLLASSAQNTFLRGVSVLFVSWRIVDVLAADIRMCVFDAYDQTYRKGAQQTYVRTMPSRVILLGILNYLELIVGFAVVYAFDNKLVVPTVSSVQWGPASVGVVARSLHLSFATQLTIGYGDLAPCGWLRPVAWLQGSSGLALIALFITRYMAMLPQVD